MCPVTVFASESVWTDVHRGFTSKNLADLTRRGRPMCGRSIVPRAGKICEKIDRYGNTVATIRGSRTVPGAGRRGDIQVICNVSRSGALGWTCRGGAVRRIHRAGRNGRVYICRSLPFREVCTCSAAIRAHDNTVSEPRSRLAMLRRVKYSIIPQMCPELARSRCTFQGPSSRPCSCSRPHSFFGDQRDRNQVARHEGDSQ